jgi:transcriptional regulator with XRE-family HTH domain
VSNSINKIDFGERLLSARRMAGLLLQGLADLMENSISKKALNQFEQGKDKPETSTL